MAATTFTLSVTILQVTWKPRQAQPPLPSSLFYLYNLLSDDGLLCVLVDQARVDKKFVDRARWTKMSIMSTAGSGKFSIDRSTREYADQIWGIQPVERL